MPEQELLAQIRQELDRLQISDELTVTQHATAERLVCLEGHLDQTLLLCEAQGLLEALRACPVSVTPGVFWQAIAASTQAQAS